MTPAVDASPLSGLLAAVRPEGWEPLRAAAEARLEAEGLPDTSMEDWKYLDLSPLREPVVPAGRGGLPRPRRLGHSRPGPPRDDGHAARCS